MLKGMFRWLIILISLPLISRAAEGEVGLIRRVVIFPILVEKSMESKAEDAWWEMREELTAQRRLLVASRQFLLRNDVLQPRGQLQQADVILLGKLLDAHAIITSQLKDRKLMMQAYDTGNGVVLWRQEQQFNPSAPVTDQLPQIARKLARDFEAHIPFQGYVVVDPLIGSPTYNEAGQKVVQVDFGPITQINEGDTVQWIRITPQNFEPLFQGGGQISVFAEGTVLRKSQGLAIVMVDRINSGATIKEFQTVRSLKETERLNRNRIRDTKDKLAVNDMVIRKTDEEERWQTENRPVATTLSVVASIAAFLLLAF